MENGVLVGYRIANIKVNNDEYSVEVISNNDREVTVNVSKKMNKQEDKNGMCSFYLSMCTMPYTEDLQKIIKSCINSSLDSYVVENNDSSECTLPYFIIGYNYYNLKVENKEYDVTVYTKERKQSRAMYIVEATERHDYHCYRYDIALMSMPLVKDLSNIISHNVNSVGKL